MPTQGIEQGLYVPTTNIWDVPDISDKELLIRLYQNVNLICNVLNLKESAYYDLNEFITGQSYFPNPTLNSSTTTVAAYRPTYRLVINFGALPNTATKSVAHDIDINSGFTFTRIYATASDTTGLNYVPIPYASPTLANNIEINIDATNVNIITGSNRTNFNVCYCVVEFMKF